MNNLENILILKKGGIHIKKKNRGSFTRWCKGKVTEECIRRGKNSSNPAIRKKATFAQNVRRWKHENGGILKAQGGTPKYGLPGGIPAYMQPKPLSPIDIAIKTAHVQTNPTMLPPGVKEVVGSDGKKVAIRTEQPLVPLEQSIAEWLPGTGDVAEVGYIANDVKNGNYGNAALTAAMVALPGNVGKILRKGDIPSVSKLTEAERLGIPKGERSNPKALEDPRYWGYKQWIEKYNTALDSGNKKELQRLRDLHFRTKSPENKLVSNNSPLTLFHFSYNPPLKFNHKKLPIYFTSDEVGKSIYFPMNAYRSQKRRAYYLKMDNPLQETLESINTDGYTRHRDPKWKKELRRDQSMREEIMNYWRNKRGKIEDLGWEARRNGDKKLFRKYFNEANEITEKYLSPHASRSIPMTWKELYYPDFDFDGLIKGELRADGIIHEVDGTSHYLMYDPSAIKLTKPVTYDDNGNMISIIKRDNFKKPDPRFNDGGKL